MADWGAFAQGLSGGIGQAMQMMQTAQMMKVRQLQMKELEVKDSADKEIASILDTQRNAPEYQPIETEYEDVSTGEMSIEKEPAQKSFNQVYEYLKVAPKVYTKYGLNDKAMEISQKALEQSKAMITSATVMAKVSRKLGYNEYARALELGSAVTGEDMTDIIEAIRNKGLKGEDSPAVNEHMKKIGTIVEGYQGKVHNPTQAIALLRDVNATSRSELDAEDAKTVEDAVKDEIQAIRDKTKPHYFNSKDGGIEMVESGQVTTLRKPTEEPDIPKTDFQAFVAGNPPQEGETKAQWSKRISDSWEAKQDKRSKDKATFRVNLSGGAGGVGGGGSLPQDTVQYLVEQYELTGQMPSFGRATKNPTRDAFFNLAAKRAKERGDTGAEQAIQTASHKSRQMALNDLTKREQLIGSFTKRIDATSKVVLDLAAKYKQTDNRLLNMPINKLKGLVGSGEWQSLNLALTSLSNEIAKVESGSLGIAEVSVEQAKRMQKIHDANLSLKDLTDVVNTGVTLGSTNMQSIGEQRKELLDAMKRPQRGQPTEQPPKPIDLKQFWRK